MAYRMEKEANGRTAIVIDGFEKGIADSAYSGIANIRNLNTRYQPGVAYVNYQRLAATVSGGTMAAPTFSTTSPAGIIYILDASQQVWKQSSTGSSTFNLLSGNPSTAGTGNGIQWWQNYLVVFRGTYIDICGDGTGDAGITSSNWNTTNTTSGAWPIAAATVTLTGTPAANAVSATISSYTDSNAHSRSFWNGPTGTYQFTFGNGQITLGNLVQGATSVNWFTPILSGGASSSSLTVTPLFAGNHMSLVSSQNGNLYFCNGSFVGVLQSVPGYVFNKNNSLSYTFEYAAVGNSGVGLPANDSVVWLSEIQNQLLIAGNFRVYPWDYISTALGVPAPISEQIYKMVNLSNNIFVFAGVKGNIYISNGYSISLLKKIPDSLFGLIDPYLQWGGFMIHRNKLYFQVYASTAAGTASASAIFSLDVAAGSLPTSLDTSGSLTIENQNSFGYTPTAGSSANGLLIDYGTSTYDSYYSAWYNNSAGGIDYNTTTLYQNSEAIIESDIIPIGTFLQSRTFESVEYKLDRPLANGDSIALYFRTSLTDSYVAVGPSAVTGGSGITVATSSVATQVLSDSFNSDIQDAQWVQFKAVLSCASSGSSRIPLREIRLH